MGGSRAILERKLENQRKLLKSSMIIGFQKKKLDRGVGRWGELYPIFLGMSGIFLTLQGPLMDRHKLFQTNQTELKSNENWGRKAFLVNGGQSALIRS